MLLQATHTTTYLYSEPVSICHTEAHLAPRDHWGQSVLEHDLIIVPAPDFSLTRRGSSQSRGGVGLSSYSVTTLSMWVRGRQCDKGAHHL